MPLVQARLRRRLVLLRDLLSRARDRALQPSLSLGDLQDQLAPVFVIGANRSGTSVVSSILSQHVELEGLFGDDMSSRTDAAGHSIGFAESMHAWMQLMPDHSVRQREGQWPLWALPQYCHEVYRWRAKNDRERADLARRIQRLRRTSQQPLLKDQFNTMRVGLVVDVFPKARFVMVTRRFADFTRRAVHKWKNDGLGTRLSSAHPRVGFHWHMVNLIARYDLETYAPGQYAVVCLEELQRSEESAQESLRAAVARIGLRPVEFDCRLLAPQWARAEEELPAVGEGVYDGIQDIIDFERDLLATYEQKISDAHRGRD